VGPVFTMSITVDVAALEHQDEPAVTEPLPALPPKRDQHRQRQAGRCDFCYTPLPAFTRLRTRRVWCRVHYSLAKPFNILSLDWFADCTVSD
jgi:hypothetical protein